VRAKESSFASVTRPVGYSTLQSERYPYIITSLSGWMAAKNPEKRFWCKVPPDGGEFGEGDFGRNLRAVTLWVIPALEPVLLSQRRYRS
jgi:hypothetical protein